MTSKNEVLKSLKSIDFTDNRDREALMNFALQGRKAVQDLGVISADQDLVEEDGAYIVFTHSGTAEYTPVGADDGEAAELVLQITNGGAGTLTWDASVLWAGGSAPALTVAGVDLLKMSSPDGGVTWFGEVIDLDFS